MHNPVHDRSGTVIGLSAKAHPKPQTACDLARLFLAQVSNDERWAGRYILARVLQELYDDFAQGMEPICWRAVAIELRKMIGSPVVYKNVREAGRDRRLQAYLIPDRRLASGSQASA
jgi:hypothetical protein